MTVKDAPGPAPHAATSFFSNTSITLVGLAAGAVIAMTNEVLAAHFLGIAAYGWYGLAMMLARIGEKLAVFGVPVSVLRYLPIHLSRGERREALGIVLAGLPLSIGIGLSLAIVLANYNDWFAIHAVRQPGAAPWIGALGLAIPLLALIDLVGDVTRGFGQAWPAIVFRNLIPQLCLATTLAWLLLAGGPHLAVAYGLLGGLIVGTCLAGVAVLRLVRARIGWTRPILRFRRVYGYAVPVAANSMVSLALSGTDLFLLGILTDADTVGAYRGCMQIVLVFDLIWNAFSAATAAVYAVLVANGQHPRLQATYSAASHLSTLLAAPLLLVIIVNAVDILGLLGSAFATAAVGLVVLAVGQFVKVSLGAACIVLNVGGRQTLEAGNVALATIANLALNYVLIPHYGLLGASLSTAISLIALGLLRCWQLRRVFNLQTSFRGQLRVLVATALPALAVWLAGLALGIGPGSGLLALALRLVAIGAGIGAGLWLMGLAADERALVRTFLRKASARRT